jgi:hypothetical protein
MAVAAVATGGWCLLGVGVPASDGARTTADEPQYLLTATSLSEDGDLDIADELADERWRAWHRAPLPEQTEALAGGRRVSPHDPLLPLLLALPVRVGGWAGAKVALAGLAGALAAALVWVAARRLAVPTGTALVAVLCFTLSAPLAAYGSQLYPELPAALVVTVGLGAVTGPLRRTGPIAVLGACAVALPWLSVKYAPVAAALAAAGLWRLWRRGDRRAAGTLAAALAAAGAVSAAGHLALYGGLTPYAVGDHFAGGELTVMGRSPDHLGRSHRLIGLLVDRDFGLVAWQPAWLLALPALGALARRRAGDRVAHRHLRGPDDARLVVAGPPGGGGAPGRRAGRGVVGGRRRPPGQGSGGRRSRRGRPHLRLAGGGGPRRPADARGRSLAHHRPPPPLASPPARPGAPRPRRTAG